MHGVQHGAGSVRSGHWAPTVCQPVVSLMKDPQGLPISSCNKPNLFLQHGFRFLFIPSPT